MERLNPSQEMAVRHFGKPLLVVAGAGSGKTKTLAHKVEFLIKEKGIRPDRILALTFTNKAGKEIRERVKGVVGMDLPWSGTFHSVALRLLRERGREVGISHDFSILSEGDRDQLIRKIAQSMGLKEELLKAYISKRIEDMQEAEESELEKAFQQYLRLIREMNLLDFGCLMLYLHKLLRLSPSIRESFDFILVDEFQDTNTVQYEIIRRLSNPNICVVGDPNQCIYEWRFARPDNLLRFREDFQCDVIKLEYNYRSKPYIIHVANAILGASQAQWRELVPFLRPVRQGEEKPVIRRFEKEEEEAVWIAQKIREFLSVYKPSQIAVLVRVGYITEPIERALYNLKIPYKVVGAVRFFERAEVRDALSFLRFLINTRDRISFSRALSIATHGLGDKAIERIVELGKGDCWEGSILALKDLPQSKAVSLYSFLQRLSKLRKNLQDYPLAFEEFLQEIDFWSYLEESYKKGEERQENVRELLRYLRQKHTEGYSLEEVLREIGFLLEQEEEEGAVRIMTIHASKGLEFNVVFLPRLEEGILPHEKALEAQEELEEELRLFYVAITRAKDLLFMSYTRSSKRPSRFLSYIPKNLLDLSFFAKKKTSYMPELKSPYRIKVGDRVRHEVFGEGVVLSLEDSRAAVEFKAGRKTIHTAFLKPVV
ncbi:MAG: ATP-dependent helicase [Aquificaceae bacterium]|nr:ATP-dependent helicase [Aquificaceae bacterium]MDW8424090.1 ATP-dependent helicase [Aquificaceae bacterium]